MFAQRILRFRAYTLLVPAAYFLAASCAPSACLGQKKGPTATIEIIEQGKGVRFDELEQTMHDTVTNCSISVSVPPRSELRKVETPYGMLMIRSHRLDLGDTIVTMTQTKHPEGLLKSLKVDLRNEPEKLLAMMSKSALQMKPKSKINGQKSVTLQGANGVEQVITYPAGASEKKTYPAGITIMRTYIRNGIVYVVMVDVDRSKATESKRKEIFGYLNSFAFTDKN